MNCLCNGRSRNKSVGFGSGFGVGGIAPWSSEDAGQNKPLIYLRTKEDAGTSCRVKAKPLPTATSEREGLKKPRSRRAASFKFLITSPTREIKTPDGRPKSKSSAKERGEDESTRRDTGNDRLYNPPCETSSGGHGGRSDQGEHWGSELLEGKKGKNGGTDCAEKSVPGRENDPALNWGVRFQSIKRQHHTSTEENKRKTTPAEKHAQGGKKRIHANSSKDA